MLTKKRQLGDVGEEQAVKFLKRKGYKILARNWRKHNCGELDIVAAKAASFFEKTKEVIFIEVKTIRLEEENAAALAAQNVHYQKQQRLIKTAQKYLLDKKMPKDILWQIDVVVVVLNADDSLVEIEHLENAVWR